MPEDTERSVDMWTPYKELLNTVEATIARPSGGIPPNFIQLLKRHKQNFITILKNPPKNAKSREELRKGATEGITLPDVGHQILSKDLVDEALILSDMYNLNELMALDLLCTAQAQMPYHPGLTRGLVAVLLYYDGRKSLVLALKALVLARRGFTFVADCSEEVSDLVTEYTNELLADGLIPKLLDLINSLDLSKEVELLQQNRALGGAKHHKQVVDLFESIRTNLASIIFYWAAQSGLPQDSALRLIQELKRTPLQTDSAGGADSVTLTLTLASLYAIDLSLLQRMEDTDPIVHEHPLISNKAFIPALMKELGTVNGWATPGLGAVTSLAWGLSLATLRQAPQHLHPIELNDEDEAAVDVSIEANVFEFLLRTLFENPQVYNQEFYIRRFHQLLTDFIVLMPQKVREMKNKGEEASRVTYMYHSQGLEAPQVSHQLESLLLAIARLYSEDPLELELCLDYWCSKTNSTQYSQRTQPRQVSLFKFVRKMGENIPSLLFVPYLKMLCSLSRSPESAQLCFSMLKQDANSTISWDHFFSSLNRYYSNLRTELPPVSDTVYRHRGMPKGITPQEVQGLHAVLAVIRTVAEFDEMSRVALCENPAWAPLTVLLGLISCSVPILLKADLLLALARLARSPATAATLWHNFEASQILTTIPSTSSYSPRGIKTELEEIESRNEEYPLTRALLTLLDTLTDFPAPRLLGAGTRTPGLDPYINFVLGSVFLKFHQRGYRRPEEKWQISGQCLGLAGKLLNQYEPHPQDFAGPGVTTVNPPPGYHVMVNMNTKSELLRLVLQILEDGVQMLDTFAPFPEKEALEETVLRSLELIDSALSLQQPFLQLASSAGGSLLLPGLTRLLLGNNPRTGRPDHLLTVARYMRYSMWLPSHAWRAARILVVATAQPGAQAHLVSLFSSTSALRTEIRHGFVECLEAEGDENEDGIRSKTKEAILKLIEDSLPLPLPNIAFYLIGFDLSKDVNKTVFQQPGVAQAPRTALHSLLALLNLGLRARSGELAVPPSPRLLEASYRLLYKLCSGARSASPVLRFLRAGASFLPKHLAALPFKQHREPAERRQMAWLLKTAAVELKVCANSKLTSHVESLFSAIVGDSADEEDEPRDWNPRVLDPDSMTTSSISGKRNDQRFLRLLSLIPFQTEAEDNPDLEIFDWSEVNSVMARCQVLEEDVLVVDIKKLHRTLTEEASVVAGKAAAQRRLVQKDIETICLHAVATNKLRTRSAASLQLMAAWRRLAETLFAVAPPAVLTNDYRQELLIDTLHTLLYKVLSASNVPSEMASLASEVLIMLVADLRIAQIVEGRETAGQRSDPREVSLRGLGDELRPSELGGSGDINIMLSTIQANANTLKNILCGILQWIVNSSVSSQKLRANLYGSLLNFLYTTCFDSEDEEVEDVNWLDASRSRPIGSAEKEQRRLVLRVVSGFAEGLAGALSNDSTGGHGLTRMLALSCLEVLMRLDPSPAWRSFLSEHGYLQLLIDELIVADKALVDLCTGDRVRNLRPLYMYDSKLALFTCIACSKDGALLLVEHSAVSVLSSMKVFDITPKLFGGKVDEFLPSPTERFQQVLFPALDLLDTLTTSLGTENRSGNEAILNFLLCHGDMVATVLRGAYSYLPIAARLTSLIARTADVGPVEETGQRLGAHTPHLLRTLMLDLIPRCLLSEARNITSENPEYLIHVLQIACNLMVYVRALSSSKDRLDCRATEPVLWPGLTEAQGGEGRGGAGPLLGSVVQLLHEAVAHYHRELSNLAELKRKLTSIPTMTSTEIQEIAETRAQALSLTRDQLAQKTLELDLTSFLVENTLYVTWSHVDFFMLRALPRPKATPDYSERKASVLSVTPQDISGLKSGLVSIFNDTFCKKLVDTQDAAASDRGFPEALVRRIKRLLQFVPVK